MFLYPHNNRYIDDVFAPLRDFFYSIFLWTPHFTLHSSLLSKRIHFLMFFSRYKEKKISNSSDLFEFLQKLYKKSRRILNFLRKIRKKYSLFRRYYFLRSGFIFSFQMKKHSITIDENFFVRESEILPSSRSILGSSRRSIV